jgi:hypothetical protein
MPDLLTRALAVLTLVFLLVLLWPFGGYWRPAALLVLVALLWAMSLLTVLAPLREAPFWSAAIAFVRRRITAGGQIARPETDTRPGALVLIPDSGTPSTKLIPAFSQNSGRRPELQAHCRIEIQDAGGLPVATERQS